MTLPSTDADVIIGAGDIGVGTDGIEWLAASGKPTIYVAGNHEFYGGEMGQVRSELKAAAQNTNVHYLECDEVEIDGVRFIGATLWTSFLSGNDKLMDALKSNMNDYFQIRNGENLLAPEDLLEINATTRDWLRNRLASPFQGHTVVVTHHAPLYASWHMPPDSLFKGAYCNDLSEFFANYPIALWVHGHVHARKVYRANGIRVSCNPRGYHGHQTVEGFNAAETIELD